MPFFPLLPIFAILMQTVLAVWLVNMSIIAWIIAQSTDKPLVMVEASSGVSSIIKRFV